MKKTIFIFLIIISAIFLINTQLFSNPRTAGLVSVSVKGLYPNKLLTPGKAETLNAKDLTALYNGKTYSQSHRAVNDTLKKNIYAEYGVIYPQPAGEYEVDHFYPLCAGGSNDPQNLWLQPAHVFFQGEDYGYHAKDVLEAHVCAQIKNGNIDPQIAYKKITSDWIKYYQELKLGTMLGAEAYTDDQ